MFLYLTTNGSTVTKDGWRIIIKSFKGDSDTNERQIPLSLVEWIVVFGQIHLSTSVIKACLKGKIPVFFVSKYGNYFGKLDSLEFKNVDFLYNHINASMDEQISLQYAKKFIQAKVQNSRTMLMRWSRVYKKEITGSTLNDLQYYHNQIEKAESKESLRWYEWTCAKIYFQAFAQFIANPFTFNERNRRPPKDPVNSLLSLWYTLLAQTIQMILDIYGVNTQIGFFHQPKDIRSLLVLDVMEMFRSWIVDDLVVRMTQTQKMNLTHFHIDQSNEARPVLLTDDGLRLFIDQYYKTVFKQKEWVSAGVEFIKLKMVEKNMEKFKASLVQKSRDYEGFTIK